MIACGVQLCYYHQKAAEIPYHTVRRSNLAFNSFLRQVTLFKICSEQHPISPKGA